ncbi:MAG: hypothetical protein M3323_07420 [Actinomycetota bacterium]|nr:hypothetical protein [Actinomycetota bacterium]
MKKLVAAALVAAALAVPVGTAHAAEPSASAGVDAAEVARAGVSKCTGGGYRGFIVWWYDLDNPYQELNFCIYTGP